MSSPRYMSYSSLPPHLLDHLVSHEEVPYDDSSSPVSWKPLGTEYDDYQNNRSRSYYAGHNGLPSSTAGRAQRISSPYSSTGVSYDYHHTLRLDGSTPGTTPLATTPATTVAKNNDVPTSIGSYPIKPAMKSITPLDLKAAQHAEPEMTRSVVVVSPHAPSEDSGYEADPDELPPRIYTWPSWRNSIREMVITNPWFERFWLMIILLNCAVLSIEDPTDKDCVTSLCKFTHVVDYIFIVLFVVECVLKILALSFFSLPGAYIRDEWNILDFIIVLSGALTPVLVAFEVKGPGLTGLRAFRLLRPLKAVQALPAVRVLVQSILSSLPQLGNVFILYFFFLLTMGIIAVQQWKGDLGWRCVDNEWDPANASSPLEDALYDPDQICNQNDIPTIGGYYCPYGTTCRDIRMNPSMGKLSFDNIVITALTLFVALTLEGWTETMYQTIDATTYLASIFWVILIIFGAFFVLNLTIVIITEAFEKKQSDLKNSTLRSNRRTFMGDIKEILDRFACVRAIKERRAQAATRQKERSGMQYTVYQVVMLDQSKSQSPVLNQLFRRLILLAIFLNTLTLAVEYHGQPELMTDILHVSNMVFTCVFTAEAILKLYGLGLSEYFSDAFNTFDLLIVILSLVDLFFIRGGANVSAFRTFRVLRVLKLARQFPSLQRWILILVSSMKGAAILTTLLLLVIFIVALLGMQLFGGKLCHLDEDWDPSDPSLTPEELGTGMGCGGVPRSNYDTLYDAMITSFQILTGEDWNVVMYTGMVAAGDMVSLYFVLYYILGNYLMLNLFIAVLLNNRELKEQGSEHSTMHSGDENEEEDAESDFEMKEIEYSTLPGSPRAAEVDEDPGSPVASPRTVLKRGKPFEDGATTLAPDTRHTLQKQDWRPMWLRDLMESERSMFFFSQQNPIRQGMQRVAESPWFEVLVMCAIVVSTVTLAIENPLRPPDHKVERDLHLVNTIMVWIFFTEALFKAIAYGFVLHPSSYLRRESWNRLDFAIVCLSLAAMAIPGGNELSFFKILRTLRPLRFINKVQGMKIVVQALIRSLGPLANVGMISLLVWLIFGILGVQLFAGKFYKCTVLEYGDKGEFQYKEDCLNATKCWGNATEEFPAGQPCRWVTFSSHFDHLPAAFLNLFELASLEGWVTVMNLGIDAVSHTEAPRKNNTRVHAVYFLGFIIFGSFFIINLFIGVLIDTYYQEKEKASGGIFLNENQRKWVEYHRKLLMALSDKEDEAARVKNASFMFVTYPAFENFITVCIVLNVLTMACEHAHQSSTFERVIEIFNYAFIGIFTLEALLKIVAFGLKTYFKETWNRFDFFIVMLSWIGMLVSLFIKIGAVVSVFRIMRLARLLRMVKKAKGIRHILKTLYLSIPSLINVAGILSLQFFIYAVAGTKLFAKVKRGPSMNQYANFESFGLSLLLLLRMSTGEAWQAILADLNVQPPDCSTHLGECGEAVFSTIYFCSFTLAGMYILLNLFIAVILDNFSASADSNSGSSAVTEEYMEHVNEVYYRQCSLSNSDPDMGLRHRQVVQFLREIGPPLGPESDISDKNMEKFVVHLNLNMSEEDRVPLHEILSKLFQHQFSTELPEEQEMKLQKKLDKTLSRKNTVPLTKNLSKTLITMRANALIVGAMARYRCRKIRDARGPPTTTSLTTKGSSDDTLLGDEYPEGELRDLSITPEVHPSIYPPPRSPSLTVGLKGGIITATPVTTPHSLPKRHSMDRGHYAATFGRSATAGRTQITLTQTPHDSSPRSNASSPMSPLPPSPSKPAPTTTTSGRAQLTRRELQDVLVRYYTNWHSCTEAQRNYYLKYYDKVFNK